MEEKDIDYEEISTKFECVKLGMRHTKDGHVISFAINPHDTPQELMTDPLGQRYIIVAVRLDGEDKPVAPEITEEGKRAVALAGTLCGDEMFQEWLCISGETDKYSEEAASVAMRRLLGVASRAELKTNAGARQKLKEIRDNFVCWLNHRRR